MLDKLEGKEGSILLTNGIEGRNFKLDGNYAVPIGQDDPQVKIVQNDVDNAFIQLGTRYSVNGGFYPLKPADDGQAQADRAAQADGGRGPQDRRAQPGLTASSRRPTSRRARPSTRSSRTPGSSTCPATIDENGLKAEIKRWYAGGGTKVAQEINDLVLKK